MQTPSTTRRSTQISGHGMRIRDIDLGTFLITLLAIVLGAAFLVAPRILANIGSGTRFGDQLELSQAFGKAFVGYWSSGDPEFGPNLQSIVDYWFRYHVAKAVIAMILLVVTVLLSLRIWKAFLVDGLRLARKVTLGLTGMLAAILAVVSLTAVMANIQGALTPFASLLSMLPVSKTVETDSALADSLGQIRALLTVYPTSTQTPPAIEVMINSSARFHLVMAVVGAIVAIGLSGITMLLLIRMRRLLDRRTRRLTGSFSAFFGVLSLSLIVVVVANFSTAADPAPGLLALFNGGL